MKKMEPVVCGLFQVRELWTPCRGQRGMCGGGKEMTLLRYELDHRPFLSVTSGDDKIYSAGCF